MQREKRATLISPNTEEARAVEALAKDGQHPKGSGETEEKGQDADDNNKHERQHEQASEANIKPPSHHKKAKTGDAGKYLEDHEAKYGKRDMTNQVPGQLEGGRVNRKKQHHRAGGRTENRRDDKAENDTTTSLGGVQSHRLPKKKNHPPEKRPRKQQYHHREKKDRERTSAEHQEKSSKTLDVATHTAAGPVQDSVVSSNTVIQSLMVQITNLTKPGQRESKKAEPSMRESNCITTSGTQSDHHAVSAKHICRFFCSVRLL